MNTETADVPHLPPWKKLLYLKQPYPDNYTPESFLSQLRRNLTVAKYSYRTLVSHFSLIAMHMACLVTVQVVFARIYRNTLDATKPAVGCSALTALCYAFLARDGQSSGSHGVSLRPFAVIAITLLILSPVLRSLTQSTSLDTIWALSFILCSVNVVSNDYDMHSHGVDGKQSQTQYRPIVSTNVGLLNAIVLALRLLSTRQVFCFVLFAVETSILLLWYDVSLRRRGRMKEHHVVITMVMGVATYLVYEVDKWVMVVWIIGVMGISLGLPGYFLFLQKYKNELQGPWDMAKPVLNFPVAEY